MARYKKPYKRDTKDDAGEVEQPKTRRAGEAEVGMIKALYANSTSLLDLKNRRIVYLGIEGIAVIFDDDQIEAGCAVVRRNGKNVAAWIERHPDGCYTENGQPVDMKGWIHITMRLYETSLVLWPGADDVVAM